MQTNATDHRVSGRVWDRKPERDIRDPPTSKSRQDLLDIPFELEESEEDRDDNTG